ncbi:MAG: acylneuraminate cytidylyltransferase family protein [Fimbriimonadaceae bacterium]|nr:acylneuraminate cytidylyltransferase family protein [Fimbriimonadaceae bacterium]
MARPLHPVLALIPARGGSKGLPGKNIRPLAGRPLLAHSVALAKMCPAVAEVVCSTDSEEIAAVAREAGASVPWLRPDSLSGDTAAMWPVVRHALENTPGDFGSVLLLDPTSPGRVPEDIAASVRRLEADDAADGVVGVSEPEFNPIWHCVVERDGRMADLVPEGRTYTRRQDLPRVFRINASLYLWRADFVRSCDNWRDGHMLLHEIPESRAIHIDTIDEFDAASRAIAEGRVTLPWLAR